eukprot:TRINITY_DN33197_c0_g1_i2.p1 TRINITY_DN33197_c0_g1~~TRINITY_DN33197_c0_g1_i2.p1  ORF type:complete len:449 (+),score=54.45 TRINITY_DN33197_c0_g1_i2:182-1528(+)
MTAGRSYREKCPTLILSHDVFTCGEDFVKDGCASSTLGGEVEAITQGEFDVAATYIAANVKSWNFGHYAFIGRLRSNMNNKSGVDRMLLRSRDDLEVAVKRMPTSWMRKGPQEFRDRHGIEAKNPWVDLAMLKALNERRFPYTCTLLGVHRDAANTYTVTTLAIGGDLFEWCNHRSLPAPGRDREARVAPIAVQLFGAVRWLSSLGVAHCGLCLECILRSRSEDGSMEVKLTGFGYASLSRVRSGLLGKPLYRSPEMHTTKVYRSLPVDAFALGVLLYVMACQDYPWKSTALRECPFFRYFSTRGFVRFLQKRKSAHCNSVLSDVFSAPLARILESLMRIDPGERIGIDAACAAVDAWCEGSTSEGINQLDYSFGDDDEPLIKGFVASQMGMVPTMGKIVVGTPRAPRTPCKLAKKDSDDVIVGLEDSETKQPKEAVFVRRIADFLCS